MNSNSSHADDDKPIAGGSTRAESTRHKQRDLRGIAAPSRIGRYELTSVLGRGGFGTVYQGWDSSLQRAVAVKLLHRTSEDNRLEEWLEEARTVAALDHPAIVPVYDVGRTPEGSGYMVSKLIEGGSLARSMEKNKFDFASAASIVARVAEALDYAHRQKVVHRDVKPANILIDGTGDAVLSDFGLALHESGFGAGARFVGTPAYMSPEQARHEGHRVDGRSDVYSVGVVLYELLLGVRPFRAGTVDELLDCVRTVEVRPLRQVNRDIPRELERICLKALSKRAADRHTTAGDLAEDLSRWIGEGLSTPIADEKDSAGSESARSGGSLSLDTVSVVPRGLRPFDASDSDFFLHLLPGARDRGGVPECVRFWRAQIDEQHQESTFRVGVLLGPSGSGKSSLVRAGIVPRLDPAVIVLRLDARQEGFEQYLLRRLGNTIAELKQARSLPEAMSWIRHRRGLASGAKVLLVIDQFEQWLNHNHANNDLELLEALRQCDGASLQTLLLVRDDFMIPVAEFMDALEEPLLQNHNFATVDLFGADHTREVLTAFGRAYGTIDDPPNLEQRRFLDAAVKELSSNGRVVPVHLALFADMIKDKPWTTAALRGLGGTRGVGLAFLEERLAGSSANPFFLSHPGAVRRLLAELLPGDDSAIKPPARTLAELSTSLRDVGTEDWLQRLLGLLDTEVRLVTPSGRSTGPSDSTGSASESGSIASSREPKYQLTHDYLVPSIRRWLAMEEHRTRAGRSRSRLRELAHAWEVRPETRRLPSLREWLTIGGLTRWSSWSDLERRMMSTASRRIMWTSATLLLVCTLAWLSGRQFYSRFLADEFAQRLINADTSEVPSILQEARHYDPAFTAALRRVPEDDSDPRRSLNMSLALAQSDPARWRDLLDHLDEVRVEHLGHVRDLTVGLNANMQSDVWARIETAESIHGKALFGSLLAQSSSTDQRWRPHIAELVQAIMQARPDDFRHFIEWLSPLREQLTDATLKRLRDPDNIRSEIQRSQLIEMAATYVCSGPSPRLAEAVSLVTSKELPAFTNRIVNDTSLRTGLRKRFAELHAQQRERIRPLGDTGSLAALTRELEHYGGFLDGNNGLASAVPHSEFETLANALSAAGYEPLCVRPYSSGGEKLVAGVWKRGDGQWKIHWLLAPDEAKTINSDLEKQGFHLRDFAWDSPTTVPRRLSALWVKAVDPAAEEKQVAILDATFTDLLLKNRELGAGWGVERFAIHHNQEHQTRCCAILKKFPHDHEADVAVQMRCAFGDRHPGNLRSDLRFTWLDPSLPDRTLVWQVAAEYEANVRRSSGDDADRAKLLAGKYLSAASQFQLAYERLDSVSELDDKLSLRTYSAYLAARARDVEKLEADIAWFQETGRTKSAGTFRLQAAALRGESEEVEKLLTIERAVSNDSGAQFSRFLLALATVASVKELGATADRAAEELYQRSRELIEGRRRNDPALLLSYVDFDFAREMPEFQALLREKQMDQCFTTASYPDVRFESRILYGLSPSEHRSRWESLRQEGFRPISLCVQVNSFDGRQEVCSAWRRRVVPTKRQNELSRALGNLALVSAHLGELDLLVEGLNDQYARDVRSYLTLHSPVLVDSSELVRALRESRSAREQISIVQTLGSYYPNEVNAADLEYVTLQLQGWAANAADAGLRNSAVWALKTWKIPMSDAPVPSQQPHNRNNWYLNGAGLTMVTVRPPGTFIMGSPEWELGRQASMNEILHHAQLDHEFAMSATEVTVKQFQQFWNDPKVKQFYGDTQFDYNQFRAPQLDCPQIEVSWLHAARFCQWLSEQEGIPEQQWCYPGVWDPRAKATILPNEYRLRTGYRLPTEVEWEYAAHGGTSLSRYCGNDLQQLVGFEWIKDNSDEVTNAVGTLRPNDLGFWDLLGNVSEWCDNRMKRLEFPRDGFIVPFDAGSPDGFPGDADEMAVRGGRYSWPATSARAAEIHMTEASDTPITIGFRVARTVRSNP